MSILLDDHDSGNVSQSDSFNNSGNSPIGSGSNNANIKHSPSFKKTSKYIYGFDDEEDDEEEEDEENNNNNENSDEEDEDEEENCEDEYESYKIQQQAKRREYEPDRIEIRNWARNQRNNDTRQRGRTSRSTGKFYQVYILTLLLNY